MKSKESPKGEDYSFLENYLRIDEEKDWNHLQAQMKNGTRNRSMGRFAFLKVAAVALAVLGIGYLALQLAGSGPELIRVQADSGIRKLSLPDGSLVVLNRGAVLSWPEKFSGKERKVSLEGEAWFEVAKDASLSFLVDVDGRAQVEVLGTRFNVCAGDEGGKVKVQVEEGKVAFSALRELASGQGGERLLLGAGQGALLDTDGTLKEVSADRNDLSWRTGILVFDQHPLWLVLEALEAHYHCSIHLDSSLDSSLTFTSTIRDQDLEEVLEELCLVLGLNYVMTGETIHIKEMGHAFPGKKD